MTTKTEKPIEEREAEKIAREVWKQIRLPSSMCRDCADHDGYCPNTRLACDPWSIIETAILSAQSSLRERIQELEEENHHFAHSGIVEIAIRNPNVSSYIDHWEGRATAAEAKVERLRKAGQQLLNRLDGQGHMGGHPYFDEYAELRAALRDTETVG